MRAGIFSPQDDRTDELRSKILEDILEDLLKDPIKHFMRDLIKLLMDSYAPVIPKVHPRDAMPLDILLVAVFAHRKIAAHLHIALDKAKEEFAVRWRDSAHSLDPVTSLDYQTLMEQNRRWVDDIFSPRLSHFLTSIPLPNQEHTEDSGSSA